ncbi:MAG: 1-acyl-sn-glycerol-3-phosphate acyltransferase [Candidatus Cloacimonetes bacterium]|nr:1-acyl-sn-glycerol-3-phosphate acyltransferase [Candidatus Cloacimonadota bacterium]MCF7814429.1 1-acyl-sn-glycerol-3-phosphate acyltransferase [Candidatus Cloacimonadota bacterium]MCF7869009.1 1-acyl-sn-glycerol-3-phosphate acyltransferase [Candidatus Cloacimonadota bacterium]MCF7884413.1 1-acyl-sn-glycerol-3-phosphate acyltransferase [Candidatus Cloacimonadota bacterium]
MRRTYAAITALVRLYMRIFWRLKIYNKERLSNLQNCIIAANHISAFDPPFIGSLVPFEIHYLAKWELFKNKLFGAFLLSVNCIPIKRGRIDKSAITRVKLVLRKKRSILIFPEGTRKSTRVKSGIGKFAIEAKTDICPVYIENSTDFWSCFLGKKRLKIVIGEKIKSDEFAGLQANKENYQKLSENVMKKILELKNEC